MKFTRHKISAGSLLVILLAVFSIVRSCQRPDTEKKAADMHRHAGEVLAQLARQALGGPGRVLVLEPGSELPDSRKQAWLIGQVEAFYQALGPDVSILAKEAFPLLLSRMSQTEGRVTGLTLQRYRALLAQYPNADVVVSFVGVPFPEEDWTRDRDPLPPMVCICLSGEHLEEFMIHGVVTGAIAPRREPVPISSIKGDWFNVMYQVVTPETVQAWAEEISPR